MPVKTAPAEKVVVKKVEVTLLPGQASLLFDWTSPVLMAIAGTGGGKTRLLYFFAQLRMTAYPGSTGLITEPTYNLLEKVLLQSSDPDRPSLIQWFTDLGWHPVYESGKKILHTDQGQIYLGSADKPESIQGAPVKWAAADEIGQCSLLFFETIRQRTAMMQGQVLGSTTPYNLGWLKTEVDDRNGQGIHVEHWRSIDRPGFPRERYEYERAHLPSWRFAMLYEGRFERPAGLVYSDFADSCVVPRQGLKAEWPVYTGHDFGTANSAALFYAHDPSSDVLWLFHEYMPGPGVTVHDQVKEFKRITEGKNVVLRMGGSHQEEQVRLLYTAEGWDIKEPELSRVEPGILAVQELHRMNRIRAFNDMTHYLDETHKPTNELDDNKSRFHYMDAERYLATYFARKSPPEGERAPAIRNYARTR